MDTEDGTGMALLHNTREFVEDIEINEMKKTDRYEQSTVTSKRAGWRRGAFLAAGTAFVSLIVNTSALAGMLVHSHRTATPISNVNLALLDQDCAQLARTNTILHLGINLIAAALLSGTNYCMQCLTAPTRLEIEKAHSERRWLDVGVMSIRNLKSIGGWKLIWWCCLIFSSLPLHLLYNSVFFASTTANEYYVLFVNDDFVAGVRPSPEPSWEWPENRPVTPIDIQNELHTFQYLSNADCIDAYGKDFVNDRSTVVVVLDPGTPVSGIAPQASSSLLDSSNVVYDHRTGSDGFTFDPYGWICREESECSSSVWGVDSCCFNNITNVRKDPANWKPLNSYQKAEYCFSKRSTPRCILYGNWAILLSVIVCNILKVVGMLYIAVRLPDSIFVTVGDAVQSFLQMPDETTKATGLITRMSFRNGAWAGHLSSASSPDRSRDTSWVPNKIRYASAASTGRWMVFIVTWLLAACVTCGLLVKAVQSSGTSPPLSLGFGGTHLQTIITGWNVERIASTSLRIVASVMIANSPQLILSVLYFSLNGLVTQMCIASEWSGYARDRKPLRVSNVRKGQRGTYFLQVPYRFGVPLIVISGILHWLVSQSIFLTVVNIVEDYSMEITPFAIVSCGFSPLAMMITLVVGVVVLILLIWSSFKVVKSDIPLAGSCSAAISAACHDPSYQCDDELRPLQWGVIVASGSDEAIQHCSFSANDVEPLQQGTVHA